MIIVKKQNKEITIPEVQKKAYLELGYSVINECGEVVELGCATDYTDLKTENETLKSEITKLKEDNKKINFENKKLKKELDKLGNKEEK